MQGIAFQARVSAHIFHVLVLHRSVACTDAADFPSRSVSDAIRHCNAVSPSLCVGLAAQEVALRHSDTRFRSA